MSRKRIQFSSTLKAELMDNLRNLSNNSGIPISKLLDQSIELLLEYYNRESPPYRNPMNARSNTQADNTSSMINDKNSPMSTKDSDTNYSSDTIPQIKLINESVNEAQKYLDLMRMYRDKIIEDAKILESVFTEHTNEKYINELMTENKTTSTPQFNSSESDK